MRYTHVIFGLILILSCSGSIEMNDKLVNSLNDTSISIRGNLIVISEDDYRFDYYDIYESDSHKDYLQNEGFQAGGYSWEGIVYGAIKLSEPSILNSIRFDPEAEGLAIWSADRECLEKIGRLIAVLKTDDEILLESISVAKKRFKME